MKSFPHINYDTCSANLACSILNYYGIKAPHKTLPLADKLLQSDEYDNMILLLLDGLGISAMKQGPSLEPRALNFFVKPECMETFPQIFNRYFENDFMLCTKQEVEVPLIAIKA